MPQKKKPGVFCLEGEWSNKLTDRSSVEPLLRMLEGLDLINVIHRDAGTRAELDHYTRKWTQAQYKDYSLGYFAFHGDRNCIQLGRESVTLEELGETLQGRCTGRVLYFGSCSTLATDSTTLRNFCKLTGAKAICGYAGDVGWLMSAAFDTLLINELVTAGYVGTVPARMERSYPDLTKKLRFKLITPASPSRQE